jgi:hypothetical protein
MWQEFPETSGNIFRNAHGIYATGRLIRLSPMLRDPIGPPIATIPNRKPYPRIAAEWLVIDS